MFPRSFVKAGCFATHLCIAFNVRHAKHPRDYSFFLLLLIQSLRYKSTVCIKWKQGVCFEEPEFELGSDVQRDSNKPHMPFLGSQAHFGFQLDSIPGARRFCQSLSTLLIHLAGTQHNVYLLPASSGSACLLQDEARAVVQMPNQKVTQPGPARRSEPRLDSHESVNSLSGWYWCHGTFHCREQSGPRVWRWPSSLAHDCWASLNLWWVHSSWLVYV